MIIRDHTEMKAWQFARDLQRRVYAFVARGPARHDVDFCKQIRNSSSSAARNMAEGFGRFWPGEFSHKLRIAVGELKETQDHLDLALEEGYVTASAHAEMRRLADRAIGAAVRFAEYLDRNGDAWKKAYSARKQSEGADRSRKAGESRSPVLKNET